nr:hypothetical protein [Tanacetum cinerariifolium]
MSAKEKSGLGDVKDSHVNDRFATVAEMHAVPPLMIGIYMPPKSDFGIDESNVKILESVPKPDESKPKAVSEPKVWSDAPIIEEYESDNDDEYVFKAIVEQENLDNPHQTLKGKGTVDSGCSRHINGNKAYLVEYQDFNGVPVAFGGSKG